MNTSSLQDKVFLGLLVGVSVAFGAILWPFYAAIFWGIVLSILFAPLHRWILHFIPKNHNLAALVTLVLCLIGVVLPMAFLGISLIHQGSQIYDRLHSGQLNMGLYFEQIMAALPPWASSQLDRMELTSVAALQQKFSAMAVQASQLIASRVFDIGQNTFQFLMGVGIMLYLLFFLLRDGAALAARLRDAVPLQNEYKHQLSQKFTTVIRATVKGSIVVAAVQGTLGGFIFAVLGIQGAVLWGVLMGFLSLLPAIGSGLIWVPVAIYFFATGAVWQAVVLTAFGVGVMGLVDNILRPILVGKDTKMPDYMVLISTLGGISLFGLNGFVVGPVIAALFMSAWDIFSPPQTN